jgi:hypothetical protein
LLYLFYLLENETEILPTKKGSLGNNTRGDAA